MFFRRYYKDIAYPPPPLGAGLAQEELNLLKKNFRKISNS